MNGYLLYNGICLTLIEWFFSFFFKFSY